MSKILVHLRAPLLSMSGYGVAARMWADYLMSDDRFMVFAENIPWGGCPFIHEQDLSDKDAMKRYYTAISNYERAEQQKQQYNISIQITIPNEFSRRAQLNIGITAGIEVDRCTPQWVVKCNEMDLIIVPSKFSAEVLTETVYQAEQNGEVKYLKIVKPIHVIPHWFNKPKEIAPSKFQFSTKKNLLFVGLWGNKGGFGEDRKNVSDLIRIFLDENKDNSDAGLVLKTSIITNSPEDLHHTTNKIKQIKSNFPNVKCKIHLIHQSLTEDEMWSLYDHKQIQGFISLTNGEGFGLPLLEAAACGKPIIATNWSGHLDFLREKNGFLPVKFELKEIPECQHWEGVMEKGSRWAKIDETDARKRIKKFLESSIVVEQAAKNNVAWLEQNFSREAVLNKMKAFFDEILKMPSSDDQDDISDERVLAAKQHDFQVQSVVTKVKSRYGIEKSDKKSVIFMMPRSFGDCVISTSIIDSLIKTRHSEHDFYIATSPEYKEIFKKFEVENGAKIIDWDDVLMHDEICRRVWDYVYNPTVNVQYQLSNWTLGNGEFGVRLLEEFAKHCNIYPKDLYDYNLYLEKCAIPKKQYVTITPVSLKQSKEYKYWDDVVFNLKKMADVEIVQLGDKKEAMIPGALDYRGRSFNETMYVVSRSVLHLSPDTGTAHVAGALGVPHVVLFGSTRYNQCAPLLFQKDATQVIIDTSEACEPRCYKDACSKMKDGKNCISFIDPKTICDVAYSLLAGIRRGKTRLPVLRLDTKDLEDKSSYWFENSNAELGEIQDYLNLSKDDYGRFVNKKYEELNQ